MSTSQKISVTLNSPSDWDEWIEVIKTQALAGKVWIMSIPQRAKFRLYKSLYHHNLEMSTLKQIPLGSSPRRRERNAVYSGRTISGNGTYTIKRDNALSSLRTFHSIVCQQILPTLRIWNLRRP
jgi:hypothetical protein